MTLLSAVRAVRDCGVIRVPVRRADYAEAYAEGLLDCRAVHDNPGKLDYYLTDFGKRWANWSL